jgi:hypothetical protein
MNLLEDFLLIFWYVAWNISFWPEIVIKAFRCTSKKTHKLKIGPGTFLLSLIWDLGTVKKDKKWEKREGPVYGEFSAHGEELPSSSSRLPLHRPILQGTEGDPENQCNLAAAWRKRKMPSVPWLGTCFSCRFAHMPLVRPLWEWVGKLKDEN